MGFFSNHTQHLIAFKLDKIWFVHRVNSIHKLSKIWRQLHKITRKFIKQIWIEIPCKFSKSSNDLATPSAQSPNQCLLGMEKCLSLFGGHFAIFDRVFVVFLFFFVCFLKLKYKYTIFIFIFFPLILPMQFSCFLSNSWPLASYS